MLRTPTSILRSSLLAFIVLPGGHALALPALQEPQLQPLMAAISAEFQQYSANPVALVAPQASQPWPCAVSPADLDAFSGTVDSDNDPVMKAEFVNDARASGIPPSKLTYLNKVVTPVRGQCEAGKLSGPIEYWIEYDQLISSSMMTMKYHNLVRVRANARDGKPEGVVLIRGTTLSQRTDYADRETAEMMAKQPQPKVSTNFFIAFAAPGTAQKAQVGTSRVVVDGNVSVITHTRFSRPDGQVIEDGYGTFGGAAHHDHRRLRRNGKLHGPQQTFAGKMGDFPIPASTTCWQEGEKVLTNNCPAD